MADDGKDKVKELVEEATFDYTLGDSDTAVEKLQRAIGTDPESFEAWHALAEVEFARKNVDEALQAAEQAHEINSEDIHINTSLSRIWLGKGDKAMAEKFGAEARRLSWKEDLKEPPPGEGESGPPMA